MTVTVLMGSSIAFAVDPFATKTAVATFGAGPAASVDVTLYTFAADKPMASYGESDIATSIGFNTSSIPFGDENERWAAGTVFARLSGNLTTVASGTKVYMYTKNTTEGTYQAKAARDGKYNGLVRKGATTAYAAGDYAALKIICKKVAEAPIDAYPTDFSASYGSGMRYVLDKSDNNFDTLKAANDCHIVIGTTGNYGGFWCGCNDSGDWTNWYTGQEAIKDLIIFFGAGFANVSGGSEYGTTTITFSTVTE